MMPQLKYICRFRDRVPVEIAFLTYSDRSPVGNAPDWLGNLNRLCITYTCTVRLYDICHQSSRHTLQGNVHTIQSTGLLKNACGDLTRYTLCKFIHIMCSADSVRAEETHRAYGAVGMLWAVLVYCHRRAVDQQSETGLRA